MVCLQSIQLIKKYTPFSVTGITGKKTLMAKYCSQQKGTSVGGTDLAGVKQKWEQRVFDEKRVSFHACPEGRGLVLLSLPLQCRAKPGS